jgi:hypothetical protein
MGIHGKLLENAFPLVEKLANEGIIESRLPFLNEGKF